MSTTKMKKTHDSNVTDLKHGLQAEAEAMGDRMVHAAEGARDKAAAVAADVRDRATSAMDGARDKAAAVAADVKDRAASVAADATNRADEARVAAADAGSRLSDDLREAADRQPENSFAARALTLMAGGLSDLSRKVDGTSVTQAMTDARDLARRHPVATAAVAAAVGFALVRLARAVPASAMAARDKTDAAKG